MRRAFAPGFLAVLVLPVVAGALAAQEPYLPASLNGYRPAVLLDDSGGAAQPGVPPMMVPPVPPPGYTPIPRGDPGPNPLDRLPNIPPVQLTEAGGRAPRTANENFDGDFGGLFYTRRIVTGYTVVPRVIGFRPVTVGVTPITTTSTTTTTGNPVGRVVSVTNTTATVPVVVNEPIVVNDYVAQTRLVRLALAARYSGVLITDNDGPRPQDRVYGGFNFYDNIGKSLNPGLGNVDLQREMVGFEKTFLNGDASFGMRLPFVQQYGPPGVGGSHDVGDLTLIWKYAFINDRATGNLWSAGMLLTTPTGSGTAILADGTQATHSVLFQPWTGFVRVFDRSYVQGITSFVVPTDNRDPTLWNNSVAAGYYAYRGAVTSPLTAVIPTAEVHVRTPLNNRDPNGGVFFQDQVNLTGGLHFRFFGRAQLSAAVSVPVVGPRPWQMEAMTFFNFYF